MLDPTHVFQYILALPVAVIGPMSDELVPGGNLVVEVHFVDIGKWPQFEEEPIAIGRRKLKGLGLFGPGRYPDTRIPRGTSW